MSRYRGYSWMWKVTKVNTTVTFINKLILDMDLNCLVWTYPGYQYALTVVNQVIFKFCKKKDHCFQSFSIWHQKVSKNQKFLIIKLIVVSFPHKFLMFLTVKHYSATITYKIQLRKEYFMSFYHFNLSKSR